MGAVSGKACQAFDVTVRALAVVLMALLAPTAASASRVAVETGVGARAVAAVPSREARPVERKIATAGARPATADIRGRATGLEPIPALPDVAGLAAPPSRMPAPGVAATGSAFPRAPVAGLPPAYRVRAPPIG
jgi:hypothetical protein